MTHTRRLAGRQRHGVEAASIDTSKGPDGLWRLRTGFSTPSSGAFGSHGQPFPTERDAITAGVGILRRKAAAVIACPRYTATDIMWAQRIDAWAAEQLTPQGAFEL